MTGEPTLNLISYSPPNHHSLPSLSAAHLDLRVERERETERMMKATLKGRYEAENSSAAATIAFNAGDVKLKAFMTDATIAKGSSLNGLVLSVEKPGSFIVDYNVPKKDFRFQFMNSVRIMEKTVNLTYIHARGDNRTAVDGTVVFDPANKVSVNYGFGTGNCKLKYTYAHGEGRRTVLEPSYDVSKNTWDFSVLRRFEGGDSVKAAYQTSSKVLGLEWIRDSKVNNGSFKMLASFNLADENKAPKLMAESTWTCEI